MKTGSWELTIPAPVLAPRRSRKTGKLVERSPWLNANDTRHWRERGRLVRLWRTKARDLAVVNGLPRGLGRVHVTATVCRDRNGRADAGNWYPTAKSCIDGLVDYGLIPDDDNTHLTGPDMRPGPKGDPCLILRIELLEPFGPVEG